MQRKRIADSRMRASCPPLLESRSRSCVRPGGASSVAKSGPCTPGFDEAQNVMTLLKLSLLGLGAQFYPGQG